MLLIIFSISELQLLILAQILAIICVILCDRFLNIVKMLKNLKSFLSRFRWFSHSTR